jgi:uncharacterized protein
MKLPTKEECLNLLEEHKVDGVLLRHIMQVNKIAVFIANKFKKQGIEINVDLIDRASLLHDILKTIDLSKDDEKIKKDPIFFKDLREKFKELKHEKAASVLLKEKGYEEVGKLIEFHGFIGFKELDTWEKRILNYADSRVKWDQIVMLKERFEDLAQRYGPHNVEGYDKKANKEHHDILFKIEKEIFSHLDFKPEDLKEVIEKK